MKVGDKWSFKTGRWYNGYQEVFCEVISKNEGEIKVWLEDPSRMLAYTVTLKDSTALDHEATRNQQVLSLYDNGPKNCQTPKMKARLI